MNGIFALILREIGFGVTELLARCSLGGGEYSAKTHEVLLVEAGGTRYLADVGFGSDGIAKPLVFEEGAEREQCGGVYRITVEPRYGFALERRDAGTPGSGAVPEFAPLYAFSLEPGLPDDFIVANHYTSTHPDSFFRMMRFCTMPTPGGRVTLTDGHFKSAENGRVTERAVGGEDEFRALLAERFGLDADAAQSATRLDRI
jgi:N-hydroxyarylamine O-acetyltransferase